jgi:hypothetical protein
VEKSHFLHYASKRNEKQFHFTSKLPISTKEVRNKPWDEMKN